MIIEKRKQIRHLRPREIDWIPQPSYVQIESWGKIRLRRSTPNIIVYGSAFSSAILGYMLGILFTG